jgi:hypothetical protein
LTPEGVENLSYSELLRVAETFGIAPAEADVDGCHALPRPAENG